MVFFLTVCTIRQLAQALTLGDVVTKLHPDALFTIGLADEAQSVDLPALPYPVLPVAQVLDPVTLNRLSAQYTPTEFAAAVKPTFIRELIARTPNGGQVIYLDPNAFLYKPFAEVLGELESAQILLTPHLTSPPTDGQFPDEKYLQNVGLYNADFLALRPTAETQRMLLWWEDRVQTRAQIDFCESLCLDQIWLMHLPALFDGVRIVKKRDWHRAIWNWHERLEKAPEPPLWVNFKGLYNRDEGLFVHQTRFRLSNQPECHRLLSEYKATVATRQQPGFSKAPAFGQRPELPVIRGWKREVSLALQSATRFVDTINWNG